MMLIATFADAATRRWTRSSTRHLGRDVQLAEAAVLKLGQRTKLQTGV
jgi:hypothetical protein